MGFGISLGGWKVALGIGLAAALALAWQEIRLRGMETEAETLKAAVAARNRDVAEAVASARSESEARRFLGRAIEIEGAKVERLTARNAALGRDLARVKKEALDVPIAEGLDEADDSWRAFIDGVRLQRLAPGSVDRAGGGEPAGAGRGAEGTRGGGDLQAPPR